MGWSSYGTKAAACVCLLGACSSPPSNAGVAGPPSTAGTTSAAGNDEATIDYAVGLNWRLHVYVQAVWDHGDLGYLVFNETAEDVDVLVESIGCAPVPCTEREQLAGPWHVPAGSYDRFPGNDLAALSGLFQFWLAPAKSLGLLGSPPQPLASSLSVISNEGTNGDGGEYQDAQIETDFVVAPADHFTITVVVPEGELSLVSHAGTNDYGVQALDVLGVRSDAGEATSTSDGFSVKVPAPPIDIDSDILDRHTQARVEVDLALPADFTGGLFALFRGWLCTHSDEEGCGNGYALSRAIPIQ